MAKKTPWAKHILHTIWHETQSEKKEVKPSEMHEHSWSPAHKCLGESESTGVFGAAWSGLLLSLFETSAS